MMTPEGWDKTPYGTGMFFKDMHGGRYLIRRDGPRKRSWRLYFNGKPLHYKSKVPQSLADIAQKMESPNDRSPHR